MSESHQEHASVKLYVVFSIILCGITFVEWAIFKYRQPMHITSAIMVPALIALSIIKFAMVCGWYMHLRYDNKVLTKIFVAAIAMILATGVALSVLMH